MFLKNNQTLDKGGHHSAVRQGANLKMKEARKTDCKESHSFGNLSLHLEN